MALLEHVLALALDRDEPLLVINILVWLLRLRSFTLFHLNCLINQLDYRISQILLLVDLRLLHGLAFLVDDVPVDLGLEDL